MELYHADRHRLHFWSPAKIEVSKSQIDRNQCTKKNTRCPRSTCYPQECVRLTCHPWLPFRIGLSMAFEWPPKDSPSYGTPPKPSASPDGEAARCTRLAPSYRALPFPCLWCDCSRQTAISHLARNFCFFSRRRSCVRCCCLFRRFRNAWSFGTLAHVLKMDARTRTHRHTHTRTHTHTCT